MATAQSPPQPSRLPTAEKRNWLSEVKTEGDNLPNKMIFYAVEKYGKTTFAAQFPKVIFGMPHDELGLPTLIDSGRLKPTPYLPPFTTWQECLDAIAFLAANEHDFKVFALDTLNGLEKLCHAHVCKRDYGGDWGKKGFANYQQGPDVAIADWRGFLANLETLRQQKRMGIVCLAHARIKTFRNPSGLDFDRYTPDMNDKTWSVTHKWADIIAFGNFEVQIVQEGMKGKAKGGQQRVLYTQRTAAFDAGNRHGLPEEIDMGTSGEEAFANFIAAMKAGKESK